ncbi:uncharacterized protein LOC111377401 [Olea europaea var. sylvestris]|uniref:uncharacterized protein LOC111377401 n=1 Tax=Olea europaea var. sylvestris TaxID=158386 RepID=UPI000C1D5D3B|nr:uncharacterized protein LOC111377401 [Olea europaea var. sylvestris]
MHPVDEEHISFITDKGLYCYKMMSLGLKNAGTTYQRLVNKLFVDLIGKTMEVYVDDMHVKMLKAGKKFKWIEKCEEAFQRLKGHLGQALLLSKSKPGEILQLYLAVSNEAISAVLIREEWTTQLPVYYTNKALLSPKTRYHDMEKLALALITASRKLRTYFQAHTIHVLTNLPLRQARAAIKGQALADFVAEFANLPEVDEIMENAELPTWNLFVDGSARDTSSGAGVVLISPEGHKLNSVVRFGFKATNNVAEYEALLAGLRLAREMQVKRLLISSDSQLVVSQVNSNFLAKDKTMASYLKMVMNLVSSFKKFELIQIPHDENAHADALSKLASGKDSELLTRSFSSPLLRCVGGEEATSILREVHEGVCGNHSGGLSLAQKLLRQGYY